MSIESVMPSNHLILCHPLLLLPSVFPSIRVFSNESALCIRWSKYWSFSFSPSSEYSGLISFRIDWFDLLAVSSLSHPQVLVGRCLALSKSPREARTLLSKPSWDHAWLPGSASCQPQALREVFPQGISQSQAWTLPTVYPASLIQGVQCP